MPFGAKLINKEIKTLFRKSIHKETRIINLTNNIQDQILKN